MMFVRFFVKLTVQPVLDHVGVLTMEHADPKNCIVSPLKTTTPVRKRIKYLLKSVGPWADLTSAPRLFLINI